MNKRRLTHSNNLADQYAKSIVTSPTHFRNKMSLDTNCSFNSSASKITDKSIHYKTFSFTKSCTQSDLKSLVKRPSSSGLK